MNSVSRQPTTRRDAILSFFRANVGKSFRSDYLHGEFGSSFRSRTSELNNDPACEIRVLNHVERSTDGREASYYWAELRRSTQNSQSDAFNSAVGTTATFPEFGDVSPERYPG
jgi:hypothetical protein